MVSLDVRLVDVLDDPTTDIIAAIHVAHFSDGATVMVEGTLNTGGKGSILGTVLASLIICFLRYGLPICFNVDTQNLDLPVGIILVLVVLGREIAGQGMLSGLFKRRKKKASAA